MDIFDIHDEVIDHYGAHVRSFLSIADGDIREFISQGIFDDRALWPDALLLQASDEAIRRELKARGYRVVVIRCDDDLDSGLKESVDIFGGYAAQAAESALPNVLS